MLHFNDLTVRIEGKTILDHATAAIPTGHKVGLVGRNGAGKTTLLRVVTGDLHADDGAVTTASGARIGHVAQEAPGGDDTLIGWVLAADKERAGLLAEAETATDPHRIAAIDQKPRLLRIGPGEIACRIPCRKLHSGSAPAPASSRVTI